MSKKTIYDLLEALDISADDLLLIGTADGERKVRAAVLLGEMSGVEFATLSDILEGTRTDVAINPARGVDLVNAWETKPPAFASEQESIDGQRDDVTISPATQKAAIDEAMDGIEVEELWSDLSVLFGSPKGYQGVVSGQIQEGIDASMIMVGSAEEISEEEPSAMVMITAGASSEAAMLLVSGVGPEGDGAAMGLAAVGEEFRLDWNESGIILGELDEEDLDDEDKKDIIGMTPALTKALLPKPHTYKTISGAYSLSADDDNTTILADGTGYEIDASGLPDGARCWIVGIGGNVDGEYGDNPVNITGGLVYYGRYSIYERSQLITVHAYDGDVYVSGGGSRGS